MKNEARLKICLVASAGGHLTEMLRLMDAFKEHDVFFISHRNPRSFQLHYKKYLVGDVGAEPKEMISSMMQIFVIYLMERPDVVISTGDAVAIPAFIWAKILRIPTIYIESWSRVKKTSGTGRIIYHSS